MCVFWLLKPLFKNKWVLKFPMEILEYSQRADNCGWRLSWTAAKCCHCPRWRCTQNTRLCQHSTLYLSACVRGSCGLFSWPLCTHSVLMLPVTAWPIVNTCMSHHELKFPQQCCAHAQGPQNPATSPCFFSAPEHNLGHSMYFPWSQGSSPCHMLNSGSIPHPD